MTKLMMALLVVGLTGTVNAQIYKCEVEGKATYQDKPCVEKNPKAISAPKQKANETPVAPSSATKQDVGPNSPTGQSAPPSAADQLREKARREMEKLPPELKARIDSINAEQDAKEKARRATNKALENYVPPKVGSARQELIAGLEVFKNSDHPYQFSEREDRAGNHQFYRIFGPDGSLMYYIYVKNGVVASVDRR